MCFQVEVSATGRSLIQRGRTECVCVCVCVCARARACVCVIECDHIHQQHYF